MTRKVVDLDLLLKQYQEAVSTGDQGDVDANSPSFLSNLNPDERAELQAALWLARRRRALEPRPGFIAASQRRVLERLHLDVLPGTRDTRSIWERLTSNPVITRAVLSILVVMLLLANTNGVTASAQASFPGDVFYPVKILEEELQLFFSNTAAQDARLHTRFAQRRLADLAALVLEGSHENLPGTSQNCVAQIEKAVESILLIAQQDPELAAILAASLDERVLQQVDVLNLLQEAVPYGYGWTLKEVYEASVEGQAALIGFLPEDFSNEPGDY